MKILININENKCDSPKRKQEIVDIFIEIWLYFHQATKSIVTKNIKTYVKKVKICW